MKRKAWFRVAAIVALGTSSCMTLVAACGGDGALIGATFDGGARDALTLDDGNDGVPAEFDGTLPPRIDSGNVIPDASDTGVDSTVVFPQPAKLLIVHAATDYGPSNPDGLVRLCYATKSFTSMDFATTPLPPLPHSTEPGSPLPYPGIAIGAGGPFPNTGVPLESIALRPYLVSSKALSDRGIVGMTGGAAISRCNRLLTPGYVPDGGFSGDATAAALAENVDYWTLADIPAGTLRNDKSYVLAITGCTSNANAGAGKCGPDPSAPATPYVPPGSPGAGNLRIAILELDTTTPIAADEMGVQVVHLSPQYQATAPRPFAPIFGVNGDAASNVNALGPDASTPLVFDPVVASAALVKLKGIVTTTGYFAAHEDDPATDGPYLPMPLNNAGNIDLPNGKITIQYLTENATPPNASPLYALGKAYTFVLVGDPDETSTKKIHFLAFPNQFTPPAN